MVVGGEGTVEGMTLVFRVGGRNVAVSVRRRRSRRRWLVSAISQRQSVDNGLSVKVRDEVGYAQLAAALSAEHVELVAQTARRR